MGSEKPNFLSQPVVKNVFMYRNGDPYYEARRIVINQKRVCNFETLLREVTGGIKAPFGAVRNIYTPRGGHKVDCLDSLQSGEQYVAAGRERFKNYLQIGSRKKRMLQNLPFQPKPLPSNRISVSARFLKPIKEPCPIFVVANGDTLNPAIRLLIHQRMLSQFERILEMITEKMGLRVLGGVRSLFTYEGQQVTDGTQLESGQLYVAVGRERFKKLSYSDLLFSKPRGARRANGMKTCTLPPIYRFPKQNGNSKSVVRCGDSGGSESKASPPSHNGSNKEHLSSIVREISQARLLSLRKKRSGQSMSLGLCDNDDLDSKTDGGNCDRQSPQDQPAEEEPTSGDTKSSAGNDEKAEEEEASDENTTDKDTSVSKEEQADKEMNGQTKGDTEDETGAAKSEYEEDVSEEQAGKKEVEENKEALDESKDAVHESNEALDDCKDDLDEDKDSLDESTEISDENEEAPDERNEISDENKEVLDESKESVTHETEGKTADVSEGAADESKDSDDSHDDNAENSKKESADEQNEEVADENEEVADENKEELADERKEEDTNEKKEAHADESKEEDTNEKKDELADESKEEVTNENKEQITDESKDEVADGVSDDEVDDEVTNKSNGENKSLPPSEDQNNECDENINDNTKDHIHKDESGEDHNENKQHSDQEKSQ
ncbi:doublecortin domain-containing protein 2-like isoform X2 [Dunckerocampus dactyliophorus]|uniref:doublecortin domain-containing protein 2-like isoform X2 n=1 Tax=Dunckerocampus dactyliophorus TaxID=161453 RepID=UPI0024055078|nr:doublecortin domain-containing protein 2-like isoform X2 [Dunckerocampus dactyliophorus]